MVFSYKGFAKEQIKVTYVHTSKMIRVTGDRPLADRRWSRFNEVFSVPQNCLVDKIHGSFKNNVLTITMPKETITKMTVAEKVEKLEEKRLLEEYKRKEKEELEAEKKKKKLLEEKDELIKKLQEEAKAKEIAEAKKLQEEEAKAKEIAEAKKLQLIEEARAKVKLEAKKLQEEAKAKEELEKRKLEEEATLAKKKIQEKILKQEERKLPEVAYTKPGLGIGAKSGSEKVGEVVKAAEEKLGYVGEKEKKIGKGIMEKIRGNEIMEKIRKKEMTSEDKKLMVNVGVAALVIFALGAYVSYTFCSCSSSSSSSSSPSSSSSTKPE